MKPLASLSLDLDNLWAYQMTHGDEGWDDYGSYLDTLVPLVLERLAAEQLRITFFVVGQDAALDRNEKAIRALADAGLDVGETGAAALAGLLALVDEHRDALPVPETATVLLLVTEGVTDPANFERIVGRPPR